jgi:hypothetical protein
VSALSETEQEIQQRTRRYAIQIKLDDGDELWSDAAEGAEAARAELASLLTRIDADPFVLLGDTVVRSSEIRYVRLQERGESQPGVLETLKTRLTGGDHMTMHDSEQPTVARGGRPVPDEAPGIVEQYFGYGRRPWAETKPFFVTSEFWAAILAIAGVLIAAGVADDFDAARAWTLTAGIAAAYILSRGIAKAGSRDPNPLRGETLRERRM